jgi:hypothetical protein
MPGNTFDNEGDAETAGLTGIAAVAPHGWRDSPRSSPLSRGEACRALVSPQVDIGYAVRCVPPRALGRWFGWAMSFT